MSNEDNNRVVRGVGDALIQQARIVEDTFLQQRASLNLETRQAGQFVHGLFWASTEEANELRAAIENLMRPLWQRDLAERLSNALRISATWSAVPWIVGAVKEKCREG